MQITSKDLRVQVKGALDAVRRGEKVEITYHGKVVALLISPDNVLDKQETTAPLPGFGMWKDRQDMQDTDQYVRELRKPRYTF